MLEAFFRYLFLFYDKLAELLKTVHVTLYVYLTPRYLCQMHAQKALGVQPFGSVHKMNLTGKTGRSLIKLDNVGACGKLYFV